VTDTDLSGEPHFDIRPTSTGDVVVLAVRGELDALTAPQLSEAITNSLTAAPAALVVDFSELDFLASAGMTVLILGHELAGTSTRFAVVADGPSTRRPLGLMGLDSVFSLYPTLGAALSELRQLSTEPTFDPGAVDSSSNGDR
jgi:anti-sigma B factor antagonist